MYHRLVNEIGGDLYSRLLGELENAGFRVEQQDRQSMTDDDLADAWDYFHEQGAEATVDYLETMFGFLFIQR